jgi:hypothetical protein
MRLSRFWNARNYAFPNLAEGRRHRKRFQHLGGKKRKEKKNPPLPGRCAPRWRNLIAPCPSKHRTALELSPNPTLPWDRELFQAPKSRGHPIHTYPNTKARSTYVYDALHRIERDTLDAEHIHVYEKAFVSSTAYFRTRTQVFHSAHTIQSDETVGG